MRGEVLRGKVCVDFRWAGEEMRSCRMRKVGGRKDEFVGERMRKTCV